MNSRKCNYFGVILLSLLLSLQSIAQVTITYPSSRAVFQRDKDNIGFIPVSGIGDADISRVEARLLPVQSGQGVVTDWVLVDNSPKAGSFSGFVKGTAGWYVLQIRTFNPNGRTGAAQVERVGIGEVFVICGQSNAQGFRISGYNPKDAAEDRVNGYSFINDANIPEHPVLTGFHQLRKEKDIGPHGQSSWLWGEFGDRLVRELNVPVLFFNAAYEGTLVSDWVRSARGETVVHSGFGFQFPGRTPYSFLGNILKNHISLMGLRAVIWIQGESDGDFNTSENDYYNSLKELIEISREDAGSKINWIVYRTSLVRNISHPSIINAQNRVIRDIENVYAGPETDGIQVPRPDGAHFSNVLFGYAGLSEVAAATWRQLDTFFFNTSDPTPTGQNGFIDINIECSENNQVVLSYAGDDAQSILWNGSNRSNSISALSGIYSAAITGVDGKVRFTKSVDVSKVFPSKTPRVNAVGNIDAACVGDSITYQVDDNFLPILWHDGSTKQTFTTSVEGDIFAVYRNNFGCFSNRSNVAKPRFVPKPSKPEIVSSTNAFAACFGETLELSIKDGSDLNVVWSTGETSEVIRIEGEGVRTISASVSTDLGCDSDESEVLQVQILAAPAAPEVFRSGPYSLGVKVEEGVSNIGWLDEQGIFATNTPTIIPTNEGFYTAQGIKTFEELGISCPTEVSGFFEFKRAESTGLVVYPNPVPGDSFFLSSDKTIDKVVMTLYDSRGRTKFRQSVSDVDIPKEVLIKGDQYFGKYWLRVDYNGFFKVFPMVFE